MSSEITMSKYLIPSVRRGSDSGQYYKIMDMNGKESKSPPLASKWDAVFTCIAVYVLCLYLNFHELETCLR